eukprot:gnl/TRDRNA2_/TRDRNA2_72289_c0_seq1.p1 gnl/TRDRNA2_/TRDRNA2_72289_c0~~gnl/TRDRNA2_/TRDRNA2_72289_c0_seq1.p1  ORF type:complete len:210 (-),score=33.09 gnl/TRDRNA2_/TRDRNA2_72289_c0_seq1:83-652(-)
MSHPVALAQCKQFLADRGIQPEVMYDTAGSAKIIAKEGRRELAAIASKGAAKHYGLDVLSEEVQDDRINFTRFLELSTYPGIVRPGQRSKTSLVLALRSRPGALVHALTIFSMRGLDMTKIESRPINSLNSQTRKMIESAVPTDKDQFPVIFLIDVSGSIADPAMKNAITHLHEEPIFLRVLGSYEISS